MIAKQFPKINSDDIQQIIINGVPESKTLEYKRTLPDETTDAKKEFLADISSFANAEGGDIIFGIDAKNGVPTKVFNIGIQDNDKILLQIESIIRDGILPRIQFEVKIVEVNESKVLLIRVFKSWNKPHRVEYKNTHRFYSRNSAGKYLLDIDELKNAFISSSLITDKIREFIGLRNYAILNDEGMETLGHKGKIAFYLIPIDSLVSDRRINVFSIKDRLQPPYCNGWNSRINLEGFLNYSGKIHDNIFSYVQIYRNGIIEAVSSGLLGSFDPENNFIPSQAYEKEVISSTAGYLNLLKSLDIFPPIIFGLSFIGIRGYRLAVDRNRFLFNEDIKYTKDILNLPEIVITEYSNEIDKMLKDTFDSVWNAFGFEKSYNYDQNGRWIER